MTIRSDTNTSAAPTKVDHDSNLAGNQHVSGGIAGLDPHLPYSPAAGFPTEDVAFHEGKQWTIVGGKVHPGQGPNNLGW